MSHSLFSFNSHGCTKLAGWHPFDERQVQTFFENNLHGLLKLGAVASEWAPQGESLRMDTIAISQEGHPVIIEFKKVSDAGLLSQILTYKVCMMRHQREFEALVHAKWPATVVDWSSVRLVCIAPAFSRFDTEAIDSVQADIDLVAYQFFGQDNVLISTVKSTRIEKKQAAAPRTKRTFGQQQVAASDEVKSLLGALFTALAAHEDIYQTQTRDGVTLSASSCDLGTISLTQGLHPRIKMTMAGAPSDELAAALGSIRKGRGVTEVTLRNHEEIPSLVAWVDQECRSAMMAF